MDARQLAEAEITCMFCGRSRQQAATIICGSHAKICDACVARAEQVIASGEPAVTPRGQIGSVPGQDRLARCSFCGMRHHQVTALAAISAGPQATATICSGCLDLCDEIIEENPAG